MNRISPLLLLALVMILLLPSAAGRFIIDIAGGVLILLFAIPIVLTGLGFFGWKILQTRMKTCNSCGITIFSNIETCPACGSEINIQKDNQNSNTSIPASSVTIDVTPEENKD